MVWGDQIAIEYVGSVPFRMYTDRPRRLDCVIALARRWAARPHIVQGERTLSFDATLDAIDAKAERLTTTGVRRGDRVFLLGWGTPEWIVNFWACVQLGAVPVLGNAWWSAQEVAEALALIDPVVSLADEASARKIPPGRRHGIWAMVGESGSHCADATTCRDADANARDENDPALNIFTSGTSGQPKAVVLSHRAVLARLHMTLHITRRLPHQVDASDHDVALVTGPLFHVGTMQGLLRAFAVGETLVLPRGRFDPAEVLALIERHRIRRWAAVPTMVSRVLDHPDSRRRDLASLRSISIGGAPVSADLMRRVRDGLPGVSPRIPTGYGLTENGGQSTASGGTRDPEQLGSSGRPLPCVEIAFRAHPGLSEGEILLRSPTQMSGYYGLAESPVDRDGWLHTGDLGRLDDRGHLWITGRLKDMIIRGGENIAPAAVERVLAAVPGVREAAVFGVPHPDLGEEVMAVLVVDPGVTIVAIESALRDRIASFARPGRWRLQHDPLPVNPTGKVDKPLLAAQARAALAG